MIVGEVGSPHGLRGEVRVKSHSDNPDRFRPGGVLYLGEMPYKIKQCHRMNGEVWILRLEGVDSLPEAEALQGIVLLAPPEEPHSAQGGLYHHQLIGLDVYTKTGESLGPISDILQTGSNDVYVISSGVNEILIPATESVVVQIDLSQGVVIVDLPDGLR